MTLPVVAIIGVALCGQIYYRQSPFANDQATIVHDEPRCDASHLCPSWRDRDFPQPNRPTWYLTMKPNFTINSANKRFGTGEASAVFYG